MSDPIKVNPPVTSNQQPITPVRVPTLGQIRSGELGLFRNEVHSFIRLSNGVTHYQLTGPENGPVIVLTHGVSGPMSIWDRTVPDLTNAGFRVLRFDLFGRGFSDRLDRSENYNMDTYVTQLDELLRRLNIDGPVNLVGSSMGAIISSEFALRNRERVNRIALVGPAGFQIPPNERTQRIRDDFSRIVEHNRNYFFNPDRFSDFITRYRNQLSINGGVDAWNSTVQNVTIVQNYINGYRTLGEQNRALNRRTLLIWGENDITFPITNSENTRRALQTAELIRVREAGHVPSVEQPEIVGRALVNFFSRRSENHGRLFP